MYIKKVDGSTYGYMYELGRTTFVALHDAPKDGSGLYDPHLIIGEGPTALVVVPYAFYDDGKWVVSENPKPLHGGFRSMEIGLLINRLPHDKKNRVPRELFILQFTDVYREALIMEARNIKIQY